MAEPLKFLFQLLDKMSSPADDIAKSVDRASVAMKKAKPAGDEMTAATLKTAIAQAKQATETRRLAKELDTYTKQLQPTKRLTVEVGNLMHSFAGFRVEAGKGAVFNLAEGVEAAIGVVERLGSAIANVTTRSIEVAAAGQKTQRAFSYNLGATGGKELLDYLGRVSDASRGLYTRGQLHELAAPLVRQGIGIGDQKKWLAASLSVAERGGTASEALGALASVRTNRAIGGDTLNALGLGSFADKQRVAGQLGKQFGIGGNYAQKNPEAVLGFISERLQYQPKRVEQVMATLLSVLQKREGGALGNEAAAGQSTTEATLKRLENLPTVIYERLANGGQLNGMIDALTGFVDAITGPGGKVLINALGTVIDKLAFIVDRVGRLLGDNPDADYNRGAAEIKQQKDREFLDKIGGSAGLRPLLERAGVKTAGSTDYELRDKTDQARLQYNKELRYDKANAGVGTVLADKREEGRDFAAGFFEQLTLAKATGGADATDAIDKITGKANDMVWRGGQGVELDPSDTLVAFKRGGSLGFGGGGGGASITLQFGDINIDGAGKGGQALADEMLDRIREEAPGMLLSAFEQFAAEQG